MTLYPSSPDQITPEWLNEHCQLGGRVSKVSATIIGEGVGMLGVLGRLALEYSEGTGPSSVIAKLASPHEPILDLVQTFGFYEREINFYNHATGDIANIPRSYVAQVDSSGRAFALILEDLSHCRVPDQVAGCSADDAITVMAELARLHAHLHPENRQVVEQVCALADDCLAIVGKGIDGHFGSLLDQLLDHLRAPAAQQPGRARRCGIVTPRL